MRAARALWLCVAQLAIQPAPGVQLWQGQRRAERFVYSKLLAFLCMRGRASAAFWPCVCSDDSIQFCRMARNSNFLLLAVLVVLAAMVAGAPPVTKQIKEATQPAKMQDIKLATTGKASSQALQEADNATATDDDADDADDADAAADDDQPDGIADNEEEEGKSGFWKRIIGSNSMTPGMENHHPSKDIPALVYALPIVGFIGVGIAIAAYCSFGT